MDKSDFFFELPPGLIAQEPLAERAGSRLLALDKRTGRVTHGAFAGVAGYMNEGDCLVLNDTKVIPARLRGRRAETGGAVELLLLERKGGGEWEALAKPGRKARPGDRLTFGDELSAEVLAVTPGGNRVVRFEHDGAFEQILERVGEMPLPPYITAKLSDKTRYQTVYAAHEGSAAAPTAGLHFTPDILSQIEAKGVSIARVTLHVGVGTFRPVKARDITEHRMHDEWFRIEQDQADIINAAKQGGGRVVAVGTTSLRALESAFAGGRVCPCTGRTDIFIYPGYAFKAVDALITNFHLPESTLIMLVSALAGRESVLGAYMEAIERGYRFFSFGDAMYIY